MNTNSHIKISNVVIIIMICQYWPCCSLCLGLFFCVCIYWNQVEALLSSSRRSCVFFRGAAVEGPEHPDVGSGAGGVPAGEVGGACGGRRVPLRSAEWAGQRLHVGGEHCRTVWADWEGHWHKHHRLVHASQLTDRYQYWGETDLQYYILHREHTF